MSEAGMLAEFLDWLRRKPTFSFPSVAAPLVEDNPWLQAMMPFRAMFVTHQVGYDPNKGLWSFGEQLDAPLTDQEREQIAGLESASPEWQARLAHRIVEL